MLRGHSRHVFSSCLRTYPFRHDGGQSTVLLPETEKHRLARESHEVADAPQLSLLAAIPLRQRVKAKTARGVYVYTRSRLTCMPLWVVSWLLHPRVKHRNVARQKKGPRVPSRFSHDRRRSINTVRGPRPFGLGAMLMGRSHHTLTCLDGTFGCCCCWLRCLNTH